jgi:hypothetical protein
MKNFIHKKNFLHIIMGFLLASTAYLYLEYNYEQKILKAFVNSIHNTQNLNKYDEEAVAIAAMNKIHVQMSQKEITSMGMELNQFEQLVTSPLLQFALTKDGACGGNSLVLAQVLDGMGYNVRPGQMKVNEKFGGHIILDVNINGKWIILDPLYNLSFRNEQGQLASFEEVSSNWSYFKSQVPAHYNMDYKYDGVQYTNWAKVPVLGSIAKATISLFAGKETADNFSFRTLTLNPKKILFYLSFYLLGFSVISVLNKKYFKISLPSLRFKTRYRHVTTP